MYHFDIIILSSSEQRLMTLRLRKVLTIFTLMHVKSAPHIKFVYYTNTQHDQNTQATPNKYAVDDNAIFFYSVLQITTMSNS